MRELPGRNYVNYVFNNIEDPVGASVEHDDVSFNHDSLPIFRQSGQAAI